MSQISFALIFLAGLSDPYCMLSLIYEGERMAISDKTKQRRKSTIRQFKRENEVKVTKIELRTLEPEWNQRFKL